MLVGGIALALAATYFLVSIQFGLPPAGEHLDVSWLMVLGWSWQHGLQFGPDLAFTYGPWAIVHPWMAIGPAAFGSFLVAMLAFATLASVLVALVCRRLDGVGLLLVGAAIVAFAPALQADGAWLLVLVLLPVLVQASIDRPDSRLDAAALVLATVFLAWLALVKFSLLLAGSGLWLLAVAALAAAGQGRKSVALGIGCPLLVLALWLAADQAPGDLVAFLVHSWDGASHYGAAMGEPPVAGLDQQGMGLLLATGLLLSWLVLAQLRRPATVLLLLALGGLVMLAWRAGFTRAPGHTPFFFIAVVAAMAAVQALARAFPATRAAAVAVALVAIAVPAWQHEAEGAPGHRHAWTRVQANLRNLADPARVVRDRAAFARRHRDLHDLPALRALVGDASIDVLGFQQGLALNAGFNYRPRPVFQSYAAYSAGLIRLNERHFLERAGAPEFLLAKVQPIDRRLASSEDPLTLAAALRGYQPVHAEREFLLLQRFAADLPAWPMPAAKKFAQHRFGDWIKVPTFAIGPTMAHVQVQLSGSGRLAGLLFREPELWVDLDTPIGMLSRRLPRTALAMGFVITPLLEAGEHLVGLYGELPSTTVWRLRLRGETKGDRERFRDRVALAFAGLDMGERDAPQRRQAMRRLLYPGFSHAPSALTAFSHAPTIVDGVPALYLHAPASLDFDLPAGHFRISLLAGMLRSSVDHPGCETGNGIRVQVLTDSGPDAPPRAQVTINPNDPERPSFRQTLQTSWQQAAPGRVTVRLDDNGSAHCDLGYIEALQIDSLQGDLADPS